MNQRRKMAAAIFFLLLAGFGQAAALTLVPRFAYVANNQDDTVSIFAIRGYRLRAVGYVYTGPGSNPRSVVVTPSQTFLYVALGNIGIAGYAINNANGSLTPVPGSPFLTGPEFSLTMHPSGRFLIAITGSGVTVYGIEQGTGALTPIQTVSGDSPISAAMDPQGVFLFAANVNSNSIAAFVVNQTTGTLTPAPGSPFPSGPNPQSVAIQHGKFLYAPNGNGASVSAYAINTITGALTQLPGSPFPVGSVPVAAVTKNSFLFVGNSADKTVSQYAIDPATGSLTQVAAPFSTGSSGPLGLAASPTEPLLYVADHDSDEVMVLGITKAGALFNESSIRTRGSALSITLASGTAPVNYSPKFVYECNANSNDIWGYQIMDGTGSLGNLPGSPFATGTSPQAIVSDTNGTVLFAANSGSNNVSAFAIDSVTGALVLAPGSPYRAGSQPSAVAVDNGAHFAYTTNSASNDISAFAISPNAALTPVSGSPFANSGNGPRAITVDPRGKFVYVANALSNTVSVYAIDARTGALQNTATVNASASPTVISLNPDGKYLYVLNQSSENVSAGTGAVSRSQPIKRHQYLSAYDVDSVTGQPTQLPGSPFAGAGSSYSMVVDPMGERLYTGDTSAVIGYHLFDNRGSLRLLPSSPFGGVSGAFGLNVDLANNFLYAANNYGNSVSVFQLDRKTGNLVQLSNSPYPAGNSPTAVTVANNLQ